MNWYDYCDKSKRLFTVQCQADDTEIYTLMISDIEKMKYEFNSEFHRLMKDAFLHNQKMFTIKEKSISVCM